MYIVFLLELDQLDNEMICDEHYNYLLKACKPQQIIKWNKSRKGTKFG